MLDGGGWGRGKPPPLSFLLSVLFTSSVELLSLSSLPLHEKFKMAAKLFKM